MGRLSQSKRVFFIRALVGQPSKQILPTGPVKEDDTGHTARSNPSIPRCIVNIICTISAASTYEEEAWKYVTSNPLVAVSALCSLDRSPDVVISTDR